MSALADQIKIRASELGFSNLGIVPARPSPHLDAYLRWIRAGMHGEMHYLARDDRIARRRDLNRIIPGAKSLIVAALDYYTLRLPLDLASDPLRGRISNYAWFSDYHDVMLEKLSDLALFIQDVAHASIQYRAYVDTGAILERDHAQQGGLGFIGKNTMLIHPRRGSFFFLGEIITDARLPVDDPPASPSCGKCSRCLDVCPTSAFPEPYILDARRCISYLTIELKGAIPISLRPLMKNWVYGCDECQDICPWQRFASPAATEHFTPENLDRAVPGLTELLSLTETGFGDKYAGTPIARIGRARLVRNACVAAGNSRSSELGGKLVVLLEDESSLVRGHAAWALGQIRFGQAELQVALQAETEVLVREEITTALHQF